MNQPTSLSVLIIDILHHLNLTAPPPEISSVCVSDSHQVEAVFNSRAWDAVVIALDEPAAAPVYRLIRQKPPQTVFILLTDAPPAIPADYPRVTRLAKQAGWAEIKAAIGQALPPADNHLTDRIRELDALLAVGKSVTTIFEVDAILRKIVEEAVSLAGADEGYLLLIDALSGDLYLRAEQNLGQSQAHDFQIKISDSVAGQVIQSGQPVFIPHHTGSIKVKTGYVVQGLINVPLIHGRQAIGVLGVTLQDRQKSFRENALKVLQALADWAAIAITNARLFQQAERGSKSTVLINQISQSILSSLRVEEIPRKLVKTTTDIVGAECGSLALVDEQTQELVFQLSYDNEGREIETMRGLRMPPGRGIIGQVAATGRPQIVNDVRENKQWYSQMDQLTGFVTEEVLAVPLTTEGETIGVIELLNKRDAGFDLDDQNLLLAVASAAAIAIQNARQYESLQQAHLALKTAQARRIATEQWSILGRAAANLAHRIHNSTTIVPLAVQDLRDLLAEVPVPPALAPDIADNMNRIEQNVIRTIELADNLLRRFHQEVVAAENVNQAVAQALASVERPPNINLVEQLADDLPVIDSSSLLVDAIMELITNAIKAMPEGGQLTVSTVKQKDVIQITVSDTGSGIAPERQEKIFSLFYGDTPTGMGFGLWWVRTFLQQYGGNIGVQSEPGHGAAFTISLPVGAKKIDLSADLE